jgi:hypothetical protein
MQRPDSTATVFAVVDDRDEQHTIDLMEKGTADGEACPDKQTECKAVHPGIRRS